MKEYEKRIEEFKSGKTSGVQPRQTWIDEFISFLVGNTFARYAFIILAIGLVALLGKGR